jgi:hypothetical protein
MMIRGFLRIQVLNPAPALKYPCSFVEFQDNPADNFFPAIHAHLSFESLIF